MTQYIDKNSLIAEIDRRQKEEVFYNEDGSFTSCGDQIHYSTLESLKNLINSIEVKEIEDYIIPKHSYFEHIYHCGSEPIWKIGDILAAYQFYSDHEGEYMYGKITDVKMDENEDWLYTFEDGEKLYENMLISDEVYKKN